MFEPSRQLTSFFIAGFQYWDGATVLGDLKAGQELTLTAEPDNPKDPDAIEVRLGSKKLGYVPAKENGVISLLSFYGHASVFECRTLQVSPENDPWQQVRVGVFVRDAREE